MHKTLVLLGLCFLLIKFSLNVSCAGLKRPKRHAPDFHRAMRCYQPTINPLAIYGAYGCFCGLSGHGTPIDETDRCCYVHDMCYDAAGEMKKTFWEYIIAFPSNTFVDYDAECINGKYVCDPRNSVFRMKLCECDTAAAECFAKSALTYDSVLRDLDVTKYCVENASYDDLNLTYTVSQRKENENVGVDLNVPYNENHTLSTSSSAVSTIFVTTTSDIWPKNKNSRRTIFAIGSTAFLIFGIFFLHLLCRKKTKYQETIDRLILIHFHKSLAPLRGISGSTMKPTAAFSKGKEVTVKL